MGAAALDRVARGRYEWRGVATGKRQREAKPTRPEKADAERQRLHVAQVSGLLRGMYAAALTAFDSF